MCRSYRPLKISRKGREPLIFTSVTMMDPFTGWFEVTQYYDKKSMTIANMVKINWLVRYPWPVEIMYDQGGEFLVNEFKNILI